MSNHTFTVKGAAWFNDHDLCRSAIRYCSETDNRHYDTGLRLALDSTQPRRTIRAGSWLEDWFETRSAHRNHRQPRFRLGGTGLRLGLITRIER